MTKQEAVIKKKVPGIFILHACVPMKIRLFFMPHEITLKILLAILESPPCFYTRSLCYPDDRDALETWLNRTSSNTPDHHQLQRHLPDLKWLFRLCWNLACLEKEEIRDRRGAHPLPAPTPIRYSLAGFNWGSGRKFQRFGDYSLSQSGSPQRRGGAPGRD